MNHTLALEIDYAHEEADWVNCNLIVDGDYHRLDATRVFPPFKPLLYFVKAVAGQRFPAQFWWEDERDGICFEATAVDEDSPLMHLKIQNMRVESPWLDADIERETVIRAFLLPILDLDRNYLVAEEKWELQHQFVESVRTAIINGIPRCPDKDAARSIEIKVRSDYATEYVDGHVFIDVNVDEYPTLSILLQDTNPFWKEWIDFLGRIAQVELPAQCEYLKVDTTRWKELDEIEEYHYWTCFSAEPLNHSHNFRLRIFTRFQQEKEFLFLDEVLDRHQCLEGFASAFKKFLQEEYQLTPDLDGNTFDLRTLSMDKSA